MIISSLKLEDENYPSNLKNISDPPAVLYYDGDISSVSCDAIAMVGTRRSSYYGEEIAERFAGELAQAGITIISGLALGIDSAAHRGALKAGGKTIAVLAGGLDRIFPSENQDLAEQILNSGVLVSEHPRGVPSLPYHFPKRNRIISGLALGVVVIEAGFKSGAMITAKVALEQNREIFAVPGNIQSELNQGPHWLIKQGAKLVENVEDILEEFNIFKVFRPQPQKDFSNLSEEERKILKFITYQPRHIDEIGAKLAFDTPLFYALLASLEMKDHIRQLPGKYYIQK